jgi:hypothetical protein
MDGIKKKSLPSPRLQDWKFRVKTDELILIAPPHQMNFIPVLMKRLSFLLLAIFSLTSVPSFVTRAAFHDDAVFPEQTVKLGTWIPDIKMTVDPEEGSRGSSVYTKSPCVTLTSSLPEAKIYYEFSDDRDPLSGGIEYAGVCVEIPAREDHKKTKFQAQAVHEVNHDWKSPVIQNEFQIGEEEEVENPRIRKSIKDKKDEKKDDKGDETEISVEKLKESFFEAPLPNVSVVGAEIIPVDPPVLPVKEEVGADHDVLVNPDQEDVTEVPEENLSTDQDSLMDIVAPVNPDESVDL